jgi:hypothetical protein
MWRDVHASRMTERINIHHMPLMWWVVWFALSTFHLVPISSSRTLPQTLETTREKATE